MEYLIVLTLIVSAYVLGRRHGAAKKEKQLKARPEGCL